MKESTVQLMLSMMQHRALVNKTHRCKGLGEIGAGASTDKILKQRIAVAPEGDLVVVMDGNVYKWPTGNEASEAGKGDAERLLSLYRRWGTNLAEQIDGAYAIAVLDDRTNCLVLIRDRLGVQPLYYRKERDSFSFSSELKGLFLACAARPEIDLRAVDRFLAFGYLPGPSTLFRTMRQVRPGHILHVDAKGRISENTYWEFRYHKPFKKLQDDEAVQQFKELLRRAVARRNAKHPYAPTLLSGGLDTSAVAALLAELRPGGFKAFTVGFREQAYNEIPDARIVADHFGLDHRTLLIDFDDKFPALCERLVWHHDAPFADTSALPSYHVARLARSCTDIVFTGDFPDQLIGGSGHHEHAVDKAERLPQQLELIRSLITQPIARQCVPKACGSSFFDKAKRAIHRECHPLYMQRILMDMPVPLTLRPCLYSRGFHRALADSDPLADARRCYASVKNEDLLNKLLFFDIHFYAPDDLMVKVDRTYAAHGLEAVSPFHDRELVEFAATLPADLKLRNGQRKFVMREALRPLLPVHTLNKQKQGFAMPIGRWLTHKLPDWVCSVLTDQRSLQRGYFAPPFLKRLSENYLSGRTDYANGSDATIISLITLELWHRRFVDNSALNEKHLSLADCTSSTEPKL